jgi:glutamyl-Q tRNA(Asp) synthetase
MTITTRFAPSPTGYLHLGHAYSALLNFEAARTVGGRFLLRLEDIDQTRCRAEFYAAIAEDLQWLGLEWETPVLVQTTQMARYEAALDDLRGRGLVYRCFKSRKDIEEALAAPHAAPGFSFTGAPLPASEEQRLVATGAPYAWRLSMAAALECLSLKKECTLFFEEETDAGLVRRPASPESFGDVVLGRKESGTSYHLASVLDDALQGVSHVIRGEELREAAGLHRLLQLLLGLPAPIYRHHAMLTNAAGARLSKRDGAASLRALRDAGMTPAMVRARVGL